MGKKENRAMLRGSDTPVWRRFDGSVIQEDIEDVVMEILDKEKEDGYSIKQICVGTDSKLIRGKAVFVTAILFIRDRKGAFSIYFKEGKQNYREKGTSKTDKKFIKQRMLDEAQRTIDITYKLNDVFDLYDVDFEVHLDMNSSDKHSSYLALKETMGYVQGMGWKAVVKPDSLAATYVADRRAK